MATYILLMTLTPEGQASALRDPYYLLNVEDSIKIAGVQTLGVYAVLGEYDFVTIVEAPNNDLMARFSIELGVKAGVHITTMPVIPPSHLDVAHSEKVAEAAVGVAPEPPPTPEETERRAGR